MSTHASQSANVAVIIPVFNRPELLQRAILSVQRQTVPVREIIVVDDCSTDDTPAVAANLEVTLLRHDRNRGAATARNTGLAAAKAEWVALLDSDDEWLPNWVQTLWPQRGSHLVVCGAGLSCWDDPQRPNRYAGSIRRRVVSSPASLIPYNPIANSTTMLKRHAVLEVGAYRTDLKYAEDWDLLFRVLEHGTLLMVPKVVCIYHSHTEQKSRHGAAHTEHQERILAAYANRPWFSSHLREVRRGIRLWDTLTDGWADGRRRQAVGLAARIGSNPSRLWGVAWIWIQRIHIRRRGARLDSRGRPTLAVMPGSPTHLQRAVQLSNGRPLRKLPAQTGKALLELMWRPAASALVANHRQELAVRMLGVSAVPTWRPGGEE